MRRTERRSERSTRAVGNGDGGGPMGGEAVSTRETGGGGRIDGTEGPT